MQSTFYDYFGDPIQNTKGFPLKDFKSIIKFTGGSQPPKSIFSDTCKEGYVRLVQIRDFRTDKYLTFIPKDSARRFFKRNDVMIGRYGPPVFQILRGLEGAYNVALMKAEPKAELDNDFLFYLLAVQSIQQLVIANSQRSAGQTGVNLEFLNNLVIGVPPLELQKVWAKIALKIEDQKQNLYKQLNIQNQLFSSLQNQAFNGTL
nr:MULTISPECIES: restriction endonuclease subunit S [unclassified Acinetobacter]